MLKSGFGPIPAHIPRTSMDWPIEPDGLRETLLMLDRTYSLPIYVMENGTATIDHVGDNGEVLDQDRIDYLRAYIGAMDDAIAAGADVRGYFVWSLMDNFEWNSGFKERFGLVHVDYATLQRRPKASAAWYAEFIRARRHKQAAGLGAETVG
jgi:beta-glucosidase